jgi:hypothetical protein
MNNKILKITLISSIIILIIGYVAIQQFVVPKPTPTQRAFTTLETQLFKGSDISSLSQNFDNNINNLTLLDKESTSMAVVKDSKFVIQNSTTNPIWFSDASGVMAYQNIAGDFMIETKITSNLRSDSSKRSTGRFNSGGLAIRDPKSKNGQMNWIVYNQGSQDGFFGTELKSTQPQASSFGIDNLLGNSSQSSWFSNPIQGDSPQSTMRVCRFGSEFRFYIKPEGSDKWEEENYNSKTVVVDESKVPEAKIDNPLRLSKKMPDIVQVGIMSNSTDTTSEAKFDYINYSRITDFNKCQN